MNEVSIIINGVRYDAVDNPLSPICDDCDLVEICEYLDTDGRIATLCQSSISNKHFKKSDKKFEP